MTQYEPNLEDRPPLSLHDNADLLEEVAKSNPNVVAQFDADGRSFHIQMLGRFILQAMGNMLINVAIPADDTQASRDGFTMLNRLAAIDVANGKPYALYEFYSTGDAGPYRGKAMDVDKDHKGRGIGGSMFRALKAAEYDIKPSGKQTKEGSALLKSLARDGNV